MKAKVIPPRVIVHDRLGLPVADIPMHLPKAIGAAPSWSQAELMSCVGFMREHMAMVNTQVTQLGRPESYAGERAQVLKSALQHLSMLMLAGSELQTELTNQATAAAQEG